MMFNFPDIHFLRIADWIDAAMTWLLVNLDAVFDGIGFVILRVVMGFEALFMFIPWFVLVLLVGLAGWKLIGRIRTGIFFMVLLILIGSFGNWLCGH